jgi:hypothetical protein
VRWGWLEFLGGETLLASAFVLFTIVSTHLAKVPVLKWSAIAGLIAADGATQTALGAIAGLNNAIAKAESVHARRRGEVLVLADDGSTDERREPLLVPAKPVTGNVVISS